MDRRKNGAKGTSESLGKTANEIAAWICELRPIRQRSQIRDAYVHVIKSKNPVGGLWFVCEALESIACGVAVSSSVLHLRQIEFTIMKHTVVPPRGPQAHDVDRAWLCCSRRSKFLARLASNYAMTRLRLITTCFPTAIRRDPRCGIDSLSPLRFSCKPSSAVQLFTAPPSS